MVVRDFSTLSYLSVLRACDITARGTDRNDLKA